MKEKQSVLLLCCTLITECIVIIFYIYKFISLKAKSFMMGTKTQNKAAKKAVQITISVFCLGLNELFFIVIYNET